LEIRPTDNLIVAAKTEDDVSQLEIYVYDEAEENLYACRSSSSSSCFCTVRNESKLISGKSG
jgi:hypothetical protein